MGETSGNGGQVVQPLSDSQSTICLRTISQVKESKRQFIFDVVNEGGEKEKMELFVNFCEDTIFEMQLAAQMSDAGERLAAKEENEQDKPAKESSDMLFLSATTVYMALLALHSNIILLLKVGTPRFKKKKNKQEL